MRTGTKVKIDLEKINSESDGYSVAAESMSVNDKLTVLEKMGREDLVEIFKDWQPRQVKSRRKSAPLDQRVSITVTDKEKMMLQHDVAEINKGKVKTTVSQFVRNRAIGSIDINGWRELAVDSLNEVNDIDAKRGDLVKREREIRLELEDAEDAEDIGLLERELSEINLKFKKVLAQNEKRKNRLSGRMSMAEAEMVKWRAARLCISTSDYLRFLIFDLIPGTSGDSHLSLQAKQRFYISIIDVADNGWGEPPSIAHCTQCSNYLDEIQKLRDRVKQLETYL